VLKRPLDERHSLENALPAKRCRVSPSDALRDALDASRQASDVWRLRDSICLQRVLPLQQFPSEAERAALLEAVCGCKEAAVMALAASEVGGALSCLCSTAEIAPAQPSLDVAPLLSRLVQLRTATAIRSLTHLCLCKSLSDAERALLDSLLDESTSCSDAKMRAAAAYAYGCLGDCHAQVLVHCPLSVD
jgi:hypothetical protein